MTGDGLIAYEIRPEDIVGELDAPVTAVNTLNFLTTDRNQPEAFTTRFSTIDDAITGNVGALLVAVGWQRSFGTQHLSDPDAFLSLVGRQPQLAPAAAGIALPSILRHPDAAEVARPKLVTPFLDRRECARTVVPDRGVNVAATVVAAAGDDPSALLGWLRWAILSHSASCRGQQTSTACSFSRRPPRSPPAARASSGWPTRASTTASCPPTTSGGSSPWARTGLRGRVAAHPTHVEVPGRTPLEPTSSGD